MSKTGILPCTKGWFNFENFTQALEDYEKEDYMDVSASTSDDGKSQIFTLETSGKEEVNVPLESVHIVSILQESEVIISYDKVPESYFIQYHDMGDPYLIAEGEDSYLKAHLSLSMISGDEIFNALLDRFEKEGSNTASTSSSIGIMYRLMFVADSFVYEAELNDSSIDRYWDVRG